MRKTLSLVLTGVLFCSGCSSSYNENVATNNVTIGNSNHPPVTNRTTGQDVYTSSSYSDFTTQIMLNYGNY